METYLSSLNIALHELMSLNESVIVLGEDIKDPYGGAFKVTKGLSTEHPNRVINTPISESSIVGIGTGLALQGFLPVVEIMFGDFMTLVVDQVLNSASKFGLMYGPNVRVPLVVRTPMGGGRGYGPTHSQSIEKIFFGMPGVSVVSPSLAHNPGELLKESVLNDDGVTIFVEYKNIYNHKLLSSLGNKGLQSRQIIEENNRVAIVENFSSGKPDVVILAYGGISGEIVKLASDMIDDEINIRAIFPSLVNAIPSSDELGTLLDAEYGVLVVEMGAGDFGWGAEVVATLFLRGFIENKNKVSKISSKNDIIPSSGELEMATLAGYESILNSIMEMMS